MLSVCPVLLKYYTLLHESPSSTHLAFPEAGILIRTFAISFRDLIQDTTIAKRLERIRPQSQVRSDPAYFFLHR